MTYEPSPSFIPRIVPVVDIGEKVIEHYATDHPGLGTLLCNKHGVHFVPC